MVAHERRHAPFILVSIALGVLLCLLAAGTTLADHAYSHRYVVYGRVVDGPGEPVLGVPVTVTLPAGVSEGSCTLTPTTRSTTDGWGDYFYCFHVHSFTQTGSVVITMEGQRFEWPLDSRLRKTVQNVQLPSTDSRKDPSVVAVFATTYTVRGRVWQGQSGALVEGIRVEGIALTQVAVTATVSANSGRVEERGTTNNYGDYSIRIALPARPTSGDVTASAAAGSGIIPLHPVFMVSDLDIIVPASNPILEGLQAAWPFLAALGAIVVAAIVVTRYRPRKSRGRAVSMIPGIGRSKAARLRAAGYSTIDQLAMAEGKDIAEKTSLPMKEAKRLIRKAKEFRETAKSESSRRNQD